MDTEQPNDPSVYEHLAVVFDWGGTLMQVLPQYSGPMAAWPDVREVDGVVEALEALLGKHRMVVATNAGDSTVEQVWKALRRVGLGEYFSSVFTARELGSMKPETAFFRSIESVLSRGPQEILMVGDQYAVDIIGAKTAGWQAIWYNPAGESAPAALPLHDLEITHMSQLPGALDQLGLPDYPTCIAWLQQGGTTFPLLAHVSLVAASAYLLASWLWQKGQPLNPVLAHRGGLLHDIAKMESIRRTSPTGQQPDHAARAKELLFQRRQPALAEIADRHMLYQDPTDPRRPLTWEQKLVHFADKLCEGSRLVDPQERINALKGRYPHYAAELEASLPALLKLQQEICECLHISPASLVPKLKTRLGIK